MNEKLREWKLEEKISQNGRNCCKVIFCKGVLLLKEKCIFFCGLFIYSVLLAWLQKVRQDHAVVECKKFYIDDSYFIYFLLLRSAKHFTKDTALSQSLQSKGSIWQMCELQHFIKQERTQKVQTQLVLPSFIYCRRISSGHTVKAVMKIEARLI